MDNKMGTMPVPKVMLTMGVPIISFNYGMGDKKRVKLGVKYGLIYSEIIMIAGILVLQIFARPLVSLFHLSEETAGLCVLAIRIISPGFLFAGANIALQGVFQALDCGIGSLVVSTLRLLVIVLPLAWLFTLLPNASFMIWFAFPIAEAVAFAAAFFFLSRVKKLYQ
ncbi:MAG: MATE family efflux transporter [Eubacterium sp.]|nr:MATE family efflux transporter [Eubacterium sp.]